MNIPMTYMYIIIVNDYMETSVDFFSSETLFLATFLASFVGDVTNDGKK